MSTRVQISINASVDELKELAKCECSLTREQVPMHPNVSEEILRELSRDEDRYVRIAVVWSHKMTTELLDIMAEDGDEAVRAAVAANKKTSSKALTKLSKEKEWPTLREVARNSNTPLEIVYNLADSVNYLVDDGVLQNPNVTDEIILKLTTVSRNPAIVREILKRDSLPQAVFDIFAGHYHEDVRLMVASDIRTQDKSLAILAKDWIPSIRLAVATNPNASKDTLFILFADPDSKIHEAASKRLAQM